MNIPEKFRILPCGDAALSVEFGDTVDPDLNARVLALDAALSAAPPPGFREAIPTYRSLFVHYDPNAIRFAELARRLKEAAEACRPLAGAQRCWRIPVVYGGEYGWDLADVAKRHDMTPDEVIARHSAPQYRVYMIGFMPGYAYLGGLDPALATSRRDNPRLETPAGAIMIGGVQAGIQCLAAPSGWHILGRTPFRNFHPRRDPVFMIAPGDAVRFHAVPAADWPALEQAAERGEPVAELVTP
ncbi:MAG: 5-oxoprolinase subunit PxpB [Alphaproteobacteria bacterium]|nr:5-oxoprolinase subunit PxpB [Alphaproteobacteria bacterium]